MNLLDLVRAALSDAAGVPAPTAQPDAVAGHWRVHLPTLDAKEVIFTPGVTRAEVVAIYPGATIEALPDPPHRTPTPAQREELGRLLAAILPDDRDSQAEAMSTALADVDNALTCFRRLAAERIK